MLINGVNHIEKSATINVINEESGVYFVNRPTLENKEKPAIVKLYNILRHGYENIYS